MKKISILTHPRSEEAARLAEVVEQFCARAEVAAVRTQRTQGRDRSLDPDTDMLIAIGGDGTVLRAQRLAVRQKTPVLGVGAGRLGFLAEVVPPDVEKAMQRVLSGDYRVEHRSLITVSHHREGDSLGTYSALNDVVLARGKSPRSLWIQVVVDGATLAQFVADGVIAATATGSTAYSLAAGGPILAPQVPAILLTPIAAHLSFVQSVIVPDTSHIELSLLRPQDALFTADGQVDRQVKFGDRLVIKPSRNTAQFVRLTPSSQFYSELVSRLQYNLRPAPPVQNPSTAWLK